MKSVSKRLRTYGKRQDEAEKLVRAKKQKIEEVAQKQQKEVKVQKNKQESSSDDSSSESEDEKPAVPAKKVPAKNGSVTTPAKKGEPAPSSESSDDSSAESSEDEKPAAKAVPSKSQPAKNGTSASSSDSESSSSDDDSDEDQAPKPKVVPPVKKEPADSSQSDSDSSSDDDKKKMDVDEDDSSSEEDSDEESGEETIKTPQKVKDVEMVDAAKSEKKTFNTPATLKEQSGGSKTLFVVNLPFSVQRSDIKNFFKDAGEVVDVHLASDADGRFKGYGHIKFESAEAANKALEMNGKELLHRAVRLFFAQEKRAYTPKPYSIAYSCMKSGMCRTTAIYVRNTRRRLRGGR